MMRIVPALLLFILLHVEFLHSQTPTPTKPTAELNEARRTGWQMALLVVEKLEAGDQKNYPGIQAWLADFRKRAKGIDLKVAPEQWPALDADALLSRNPNFWAAYYEIAPADPGLAMLHTGLLLADGEAVRAAQLLVVAGQRPGIPQEIKQGLEILLAQTQKVGAKPNALVAEGIKLHDKGDYAGALKKYQESLVLWPQNGFAHYEVGFTLAMQKLVAAGEKPPPPGTVIVNSGKKNPPEVDAAFAKARRHDPFQINAYQGDDPQVIRGTLALAKKGLPFWQQLVRNRQQQVDDQTLAKLAEACQEAGVHELALASRQVMVARRSGYAPADHPFITTSLRKLAPGPQTDEVLKRLAGGKLSLRQLIAAEESKSVALNQLRLYVPTPELEDRFGKDVVPLTGYIKALERRADEILSKEKPPGAKGLLIAVGIKSRSKTRVWCEAVEGEMPAELLARLEKELGKIEGVDLKKGPAGFAMEVNLFGQKAGKFPEFPQSWVEAAKKGKAKLLVPPDELFKILWPD